MWATHTRTMITRPYTLQLARSQFRSALVLKEQWWHAGHQNHKIRVHSQRCSCWTYLFKQLVMWYCQSQKRWAVSWVSLRTTFSIETDEGPESSNIEVDVAPGVRSRQYGMRHNVWRDLSFARLLSLKSLMTPGSPYYPSMRIWVNQFAIRGSKCYCRNDPGKYCC